MANQKPNKQMEKQEQIIAKRIFACFVNFQTVYDEDFIKYESEKENIRDYINNNVVNKYEIRERVRIMIHALIKKANDIPFIESIKFDLDTFNDELFEIVEISETNEDEQ